MLVLGLLVAALCLLAPFYLVGRVVQSPGAALDEILAWSTLELTVRTLTLVAGVTLLATAIALPMAWLVERTDLPFRRAVGIVASLPLAIPSYVGATPVLRGQRVADLVQKLDHRIGQAEKQEVAGRQYPVADVLGELGPVHRGEHDGGGDHCQPDRRSHPTE